MAKKKKKKQDEEQPKEAVSYDSIEEFNRAARQRKLQEARSRGSKEYQLWRQWKDRGERKEDLVPLLQSLDNVVKSKARSIQRRGETGIPAAATEQKLRNIALHGIKSYDPNKGTKLTTHIYNQFQRYSDFEAENRNFAHIPKARFQKFQQFKNVMDDLQGQFNREPTNVELQKELQWPPDEVNRLRKEIKSELFTADDVEDIDSELQSVIQLTPNLLHSQEEKRVFEHLYPAAGRAPSINTIARRLNMSPSRVYQIRNKIRKRVAPYISKI